MRNVVRAAALVFGSALLAKFASFLRDPILASRFGADALTDSFFLLVTSIFLATNAVAIPILVALQSRAAKWTALGHPWQSQIVWCRPTVLRASLMATGVAAVAAYALTRLQGGAAADALFIVVLAAGSGAFFASLAAAAAMLLSLRHHFVGPALASIIGNAGVVAGLLILPADAQSMSEVLPWIFVGGLFVQAIPAAVFLGRNHQSGAPPSRAGGEERKRLVGAFANAWYFQGLQVVFAAGSVLAGVGTLTALTYAAKANTFVYETVALSTLTLVAPSVFRSVASNRLDRVAVKNGLTLVISFLAPAVVVILLTGDLVVRALYARQAFGAQAASVTAQAVPIYALVLIPMAIIELLSRSAIARGEGVNLILPLVAGFATDLAVVVIGAEPLGVLRFPIGVTLGTALAAALIWIHEFGSEARQAVADTAVVSFAALLGALPTAAVPRVLTLAGTVGAVATISAAFFVELLTVGLVLAVLRPALARQILTRLIARATRGTQIQDDRP